MTERPWSMTAEARDHQPRVRRAPGPARRVVGRVLWVGTNLYAGWWTVTGTVVAVATVDDVADRTADVRALALVAVTIAAATIVGIALLLDLVLRRLVRDLPRRRVVVGSAVAFALPHLYFLAVVAGLPLPWRLPGW